MQTKQALQSYITQPCLKVSNFSVELKGLHHGNCLVCEDYHLVPCSSYWELQVLLLSSLHVNVYTTWWEKQIKALFILQLNFVYTYDLIFCGIHKGATLVLRLKVLETDNVLANKSQEASRVKSIILPVMNSCAGLAVARLWMPRSVG